MVRWYRSDKLEKQRKWRGANRRRNLVVVTLNGLLTRGEDELEHLSALEADGRALLLHNMPPEVMFLSVFATLATDNTGRVRALNENGFLNGTTGTVEDVLLLQTREITLVAGNTLHLVTGLALNALRTTVVILRTNTVFGIPVLNKLLGLVLVGLSSPDGSHVDGADSGRGTSPSAAHQRAARKDTASEHG